MLNSLGFQLELDVFGSLTKCILRYLGILAVGEKLNKTFCCVLEELYFLSEMM